MKTVHFFFFLCLHSLLYGQSFEGQVLDAANGEPLIGANLFLKSDFSKGCQTDIDGRFQLTVTTLPDTFWLSYIGYEDQWIPLDEAMTEEPIVVKMKTAALLMEQVTVTAKKIVAKEFAVERIQKMEIWLNPSAKADALLAVQSLPASTNSDESANISLRGSPASETGIFLNNVPLNDVVRFDQANGIGQFSIFNTALISSVNVFPSNPPLEFGHATSGVVALYTDDRLPDKSNSLSFNLVGISGMTSQQLSKQTAVVAYANWNTHHGLVALNKKGLEDLKNFQTLDGGLYAIHRFSDHTVMKFFNFSLLEKYDFQTRSPSYEGLYKQQKKRNLSILNLSHRKGNFQWQLNQGLNLSRANYGIGLIDIEADKLDYHASWTGSYLGKKTTIKTGLSFDYYQLDNEGVYPLYDYAIREEHPAYAFDTLRQVSIPELFVYGKKNINEQWTLGGGFRWHPGFDGLNAYESYQANLAWRPKAAHTLILSAGQYEKYLLPEAVTDLLIQRSRQISMDYQWEKDRWTGSLAVYGKQNKLGDLKNPIYGAELFVSYKGKRVLGSFSMTSVESKWQREGRSYPTPQDMSYYLRAMLQYRFDGGLTVSSVFQSRQGRYYQTVSSAFEQPALQVFKPVYGSLEEGQRLPAYQKMDVSISRIFGTSFGTFIFYINSNNLLNHKNVRNLNYNRDYSQTFEEYFNQRSIFFGGVWQFEG